MTMLRSAALAIVAVLTFTAVVEAACLTTDLNNTTWYAYITYHGGWTRCIVKIDSAGAVISGTACKTYDANDGASTDTVTGGTLAVRTSCLVVNGKVITANTGTHTITEAMLDRGKSVLVGVGRDTATEPWQFSAVKK